jgi:protein subunit release factor B
MTRWREISFIEKRARSMPLPPQIDHRLAALGTSVSDVDERFIRGAGPGGQKINKTSSTVWLRHRPTGIEVRCQRERSQAANRDLAWEELCQRLEERRRQMAADRIDEREREARRKRPKSRSQKIKMIESKKHRAGIKAHRRMPFE